MKNLYKNWRIGRNGLMILSGLSLIISCSTSQTVASTSESDGIYYNPNKDTETRFGNTPYVYGDSQYNSQESNDNQVRIGGTYFDNNNNVIGDAQQSYNDTQQSADYNTAPQYAKTDNLSTNSWGTDSGTVINYNYYGGYPYYGWYGYSPYYSSPFYWRSGWSLGFSLGWNWGWGNIGWGYGYPSYWGSYSPWYGYGYYGGWNYPWYGGYYGHGYYGNRYYYDGYGYRRGGITMTNGYASNYAGRRGITMTNGTNNLANSYNISRGIRQNGINRNNVSASGTRSIINNNNQAQPQRSIIRNNGNINRNIVRDNASNGIQPSRGINNNMRSRDFGGGVINNNNSSIRNNNSIQNNNNRIRTTPNYDNNRGNQQQQTPTRSIQSSPRSQNSFPSRSTNIESRGGNFGGGSGIGGGSRGGGSMGGSRGGGRR